MGRGRDSHSEFVHLGGSEAGIVLQSHPEGAMGQVALDVDSPGEGV